MLSLDTDSKSTKISWDNSTPLRFHPIQKRQISQINIDTKWRKILHGFELIYQEWFLLISSYWLLKLDVA
jgi:hypothetical protein